MNSSIFSYLSIKYDSEEERNYVYGLIEQFTYAQNNNSYHLALFAYHLLFMSFIYQTIFKTKIWMPDRFNDVLIQSPEDKRKLHRESKTIWSLSEFPESSIFELLNILKACDPIVKKCKKIIRYRNNSFGHASGILILEEEFNKKIEEYDQMASEIQELTHNELGRIFNEYFINIEPGIKITKDDLEINLIIPNKLNEKDLECLSADCQIKPNENKVKIKEILENDFGIITQVIF